MKPRARAENKVSEYAYLCVFKKIEVETRCASTARVTCLRTLEREREKEKKRNESYRLQSKPILQFCPSRSFSLPPFRIARATLSSKGTSMMMTSTSFGSAFESMWRHGLLLFEYFPAASTRRRRTRDSHLDPGGKSKGRARSLFPPLSSEGEKSCYN